jgi:hypothetical protein
MDFCQHISWHGLFEVMRRLEDFQTLQMLLKASPDAFAVFRKSPHEIFASIAGATLDLELLRLAELTIQIHNREFSDRHEKLDDFFKRNLFDDEPNPKTFSVITASKFKETLRLVKPDVLYRVLSLAANIERLSTVILKEFIRRLAASQPHHPHPSEREFRFFSVTVEELGSPKWPHPTRPSLAYTFPPSALQGRPFSWVELYRTRRALWTLQVLLDIRDHLLGVDQFSKPEYSMTIGPLEDRSRLGPSLPYQLNPPGGLLVYPLEAKEVFRCVQDLGPCLDKSWPPDMPRRAFKPPLQGPIVDLRERLIFQSNHIPRLPRCIETPTLKDESALRLPRPQEGSKGCRLGLDEAAVKRCSPGHRLSSGILPFTLEGRSGGRLVLTLLDIFGQMQLGLRIWDLERLVMLQLARVDDTSNPGEYNQPRMSSDLAFTWLSITRSSFDHLEDHV